MAKLGFTRRKKRNRRRLRNDREPAQVRDRGDVHEVGVTDHGAARLGVGAALLSMACRRFGELGVSRVRTMVLRNDIPVLTFFRANGFVGGSFVQLERDLDEPLPHPPELST